MYTLPTDVLCGYFDCSGFGGLAVSPARTVTKFEIEFYLEDAGVTYSDERAFPIKKDWLHIVSPGEVRHSTLPFKTIYLKFSAEGELAARLNAAARYFPASDPAAVRGTLGELIQLNKSGGELLFYGKLLIFLDAVLSDSAAPDRRAGRGTVERAKDYMRANCREPLRLKNVADAVNLSPVYFHTLFSSVCGVTPRGWLAGYRMLAAERALRSSDAGIGAIAESCGFGSQQYFTKLFKKQHGVTPGEYRRRALLRYFEE